MPIMVADSGRSLFFVMYNTRIGAPMWSCRKDPSIAHLKPVGLSHDTAAAGNPDAAGHLSLIRIEVTARALDQERENRYQPALRSLN